MLNVQLAGLASGEVTVGGPSGPLVLHPEPGTALAVYRVTGWDEAQGHKVLRLMEAVGSAAADNRLTPEDLDSVSTAAGLPGSAALSIIVRASRRLLESVQDDGRVDGREAMDIASTILQAAGLFR